MRVRTVIVSRIRGGEHEPKTVGSDRSLAPWHFGTDRCRDPVTDTADTVRRRDGRGAVGGKPRCRGVLLERNRPCFRLRSVAHVSWQQHEVRGDEQARAITGMRALAYFAARRGARRRRHRERVVLPPPLTRWPSPENFRRRGHQRRLHCGRTESTEPDGHVAQDRVERAADLAERMGGRGTADEATPRQRSRAGPITHAPGRQPLRTSCGPNLSCPFSTSDMLRGRFCRSSRTLPWCTGAAQPQY